MNETFQTQIAANKRKSNLLILSLCFLGSVFFGAIGGAAFENGLPGAIFSTVGGFVLTGFAVAYAYSFGPSIVLESAGAKRIARSDDLELFNVVEEMSLAAGVPMPDVYLIDDDAQNAFATGKDWGSSAIAITTALRAKLTRDELQGVIAHEMSHILNYDVRLTTIAAVVGGAIALLSDFTLRSGRRRGSSSSGARDGGGVFALVAIVLAILAPIIAKMLQLAISRQREYLADSSAVRLTRNPQGLISALEKLIQDPAELDNANRATEHMYIVSPTHKLSAADIDSVWSTHPPMKERIARIRALGS